MVNTTFCTNALQIDECVTGGSIFLLIINAITCLTSFIYLIYYTLSNKENTPASRAIKSFVFTIGLFFAMRFSAQILPQLVYDYSYVPEVFIKEGELLLTIPFSCVSLQCIRLMKLFRLPLTTFYAVVNYIFFAISILGFIGYVYLQLFPKLIFDHNKLIRHLCVSFEYFNKMFFVSISTQAFVFNSVIRKATTKNFRLVIYILMIFVCLLTVSEIFQQTYNENHALFKNLIYFYGKDRYGMILFTAFLGYVNQLFPILALIIFMIMVQQLHSQNNPDKSSDDSVVLMTGLI